MTKALSPSVIKQHVAEAASRIGIRLRFDKVAIRVVEALQEGLSESVPDGEAVLFTITAPIKLPAKTTADIKTLAHGILSGARIRDVVHGNGVCLRRIRGVQAHMPKAIGFVHNPETNTDLLLDLAEAQLIGNGPPA